VAPTRRLDHPVFGLGASARRVTPRGAIDERRRRASAVAARARHARSQDAEPLHACSAARRPLSDPTPMSWVDFIGFAAAALTTIAFVPQAVLTWRHRKAEGVSLGMYVVFVSGVVAWLAYGVLLGSWPIIVANTITLGLAGFILAMKIRFG
jgi:MtN3 and saliva related transmembrane protein